MCFKYKLQDLNKFDPETYIEYREVFVTETTFVRRIKDIPKNHIPSRFNLVPENDAKILRRYNV